MLNSRIHSIALGALFILLAQMESIHGAYLDGAAEDTCDVTCRVSFGVTSSTYQRCYDYCASWKARKSETDDQYQREEDYCEPICDTTHHGTFEAREKCVDSCKFWARELPIPTYLKLCNVDTLIWPDCMYQEYPIYPSPN